MKKYFFIGLLLATNLAYSQSNESVFVHFATDKYVLNRSTRSTLDSLTDTLSASDRIELHGHCDARGSDEYNTRLSQQRVKAVENYLLGLGWEKKDIGVVQAHGESIPLDDNVSETGRSMNRRVEVRILRGQATTTLKQKLTDSTLKTGDNIVLRNINFEGGVAIFLKSSAPILIELLDAMHSTPHLVIRVEGHICCHADSGEGLDMNTGIQNLSEARAKAVKDYLVRNGIDEKRITYKGFGHSAPVYPFPEKSDEERTANRRVEIKIISM